MDKFDKCIECGKSVSDLEYIRYSGLCQGCYTKACMEAKRKQYKIDSKKYRFVPDGHEWHLIDKKGKIVYYMEDPLNNLFNEQIECETLDDVRNIVEGLLEDEKSYEDVSERHSLVPFDELPKSTREIMARALYDYYIVRSHTI